MWKIATFDYRKVFSLDTGTREGNPQDVFCSEVQKMGLILMGVSENRVYSQL